MQPTPVLIAQTSATSNPDASSLDEALLWDYTFYFAAEEPPATVEVVFDEERSATYPVPEGEQLAARSMTIERLDLGEIRSARAAFGEITFREPVSASIENANEIAFGSGAPATMEGHLAALFRWLRPEEFSLEVHYRYQVGGMPVEAPVALVTRQEFTEELIEHITGAMRQWQETIDPPVTDAYWRFQVTLWHAGAQVLRLSHLLLAVRDVIAR
ncbi:MAG TPA: hypothetical protein VF111_09065 [Thermoanaerobaculia bacterium]